MNFGHYLRECREANGWTQPDAASKIEIEQSYLSKLETGKSYPSEEIFNKLIAIYQINISTLYEKISSNDIDKLKDIHTIKQAGLKRKRNKLKTTRSWLITGFILISLSGVFLTFTIFPSYSSTKYTYRSDGLLDSNEELRTYDLVNKDVSQLNNNIYLIEKREILLTRLEQMDEVSSLYKGDSYVKNTLKGRRYFKLIDSREINENSTNRWFFVFFFMFLFGGLSSFYISRNWD
ncbi:MAG: helix-turn-helix domain-containing protein [Marinicellaceae bacterium]